MNSILHTFIISHPTLSVFLAGIFGASLGFSLLAWFVYCDARGDKAAQQREDQRRYELRRHEQKGGLQ